MEFNMSIKTRLINIEKKFNPRSNKQILVIGWIGADLTSPLSPYEDEYLRQTGGVIVWRD